jgi:hypothetical protein
VRHLSPRLFSGSAAVRRTRRPGWSQEKTKRQPRWRRSSSCRGPPPSMAEQSRPKLFPLDTMIFDRREKTRTLFVRRPVNAPTAGKTLGLNGVGPSPWSSLPPRRSVVFLARYALGAVGAGRPQRPPNHLE